MNLSKIFEMQKALDQKINLKRLKNHPELSKKDVEVQKTLALIIEAGEFINEVQSFKYWKVHREIKSNNVTEEFADLIHFLVNFGYEYQVNPEIEPVYVSDDINRQFQELFISITNLMQNICADTIYRAFQIAIGSFLMLGYGYENLFQAYFYKNQKNYKRYYSNY
ncbi:dUTP diphosphatase [Mycoplasma buteonis]|uniref:dUTP diphosphatase n=1 Tax=Mycoplasma buteonis TaxID=171280 RepID=UPI0005663471|nr:dUTP diphosphatase [Mycoplasma buteonis]